MRLYLIMLFLLLSVSCMAESWQDRGNYSISWYNKNSEHLVINSEQELAGLAYLVNNGYSDFNGQTVSLASDLDLSGKRWIPIGWEKTHPFRGIINGNGYSVYGMVVEAGDENINGGFLGYAEQAELTDIYIYGNVYASSPQRAGGLALQAEESKFINCMAYIDISNIYEDTYAFDYEVTVGGLVGYATDCMFSLCTHRGNIECQFGNLEGTSPEYYTKGYLYIGGIAGSIDDCDMTFCAHTEGIITGGGTGSVSTSLITYIGGIVGQSTSSDIISCHNNAEAFVLDFRGGYNVKSSAARIGGIAGYFISSYEDKEKMANCYSSTNAVEGDGGFGSTGYGTLYLGGIIGYNGSEENCSANYSPLDIEVTAVRVEMNDYKTYDGSTAFSQSDMKTTAFLEELNFYPIIEQGKAIWIIDGNNGYPRIDNGSAGIHDMDAEKVGIKITGNSITLSHAADVSLYTINGLLVFSGTTDCIAGLSGGIYILKADEMTLKIAVH